MNPERPSDPREQMEVRITALLLGEASAFEEAELLEAIKNDPQLAAYYEEMRRMVRHVEATLQSAPMETTAERPRLADDKRAQLETLFRQPAAKTINLESTTRRVRRLTHLQTAMAIAAAVMILFVAVGMLLPSLAKSKAKSSRISLRQYQAPAVAEERFVEADSPVLTHEDMSLRRVRPMSMNADSLATTTPFEKEAAEARVDEGWVARYGNSQPPSARTLGRTPAPQASAAAPLPAKPTAIFLPSAEKQAAAVDSYALALDPAKKAGAGGESARNYFGNAPANGGRPLSSEAVGDGLVAVDFDRPVVSLAVPTVGNLMVAAPAVPQAPTPAQSVPALAAFTQDDTVELRPQVITGSQIPSARTEGEPAAQVPEVRRQLAERTKVDDSQRGFVRNEALGVEAKNGVQLKDSALDGAVAAGGDFGGRAGSSRYGDVNARGGDSQGVQNAKVLLELGRVQEAEASLRAAAKADPTNPEVFYYLDKIQQNQNQVSFRNREYDSRRRLVEAEQLSRQPGAGTAPAFAGAPSGEAAPAGGPDHWYFAQPSLPATQSLAVGSQWEESSALGDQRGLGQKFQLNWAVAPGVSGGTADGRSGDAGVNDFADFSSTLSTPATVKFAKGATAQNWDVDGRQSATELFAKVPAGPALDPATGESIEQSAGATDVKLRARFRELNDQTTLGFAIGREGVESGQKGEAFGIELKRQAGTKGTLPMEERLSRIDAGKQIALQSEDYLALSKEKVAELEQLGVSEGRFAGGNASASGTGGIRFLTATNDQSSVNTAMRDYIKKETGVELAAPSMMYYNDRTGTLMVRAPKEQLELVEQAVEKLNRQADQADALATALSRFDALSDGDHDSRLAEGSPVVKSIKALADIADESVADTIAPVEQALVEKVVDESVKAKPATPPPPSLEPLPEISTKDNAFSTFSLNVSDVSLQLAASSLENGQMPDGARLRSEEFINAFDYRDPMPAPGQRVAFNWERARNPFAHNRELLRFSVQTAAAGREPGQPLNLVLLLDNSGSMERADRVQITEQMMRVLAAQLTGYDRVSFITFARTPRLIVDGATGGNPEALLKQVTGLNPDGGTNLEDAMKLAYETAAKHFQAKGNNRVILITDGAANLGNVDPQQLRERVIEQRKKGIALDCFGVGWEGFNDNLLESLSRNGDGRYGFLNDAETAPTQFASQLAGALQVAASDVKAQIEFNPNRVTVYRQIGYQQHQLTKEQFRDNTVDAAEIGAAEAGNALYSVEVNPNGSGPIGTFRVRYRVPSTGLYEEKEWVLPFAPNAAELEKAAPAMRLASTAAAFAEWLANSPYAQTVTPDALQNLMRGVPETFSPDPRPAKLQTMIQQARAISGR